jgi:hypothetical protein
LLHFSLKKLDEGGPGERETVIKQLLIYWEFLKHIISPNQIRGILKSGLFLSLKHIFIFQSPASIFFKQPLFITTKSNDFFSTIEMI